MADEDPSKGDATKSPPAKATERQEESDEGAMPRSFSAWAGLHLVLYPFLFFAGYLTSDSLGDTRVESGLLAMLIIGLPVSAYTGGNLVVDRYWGNAGAEAPGTASERVGAPLHSSELQREAARRERAASRAGFALWAARLVALARSGRSFLFLNLFTYGIVGLPLGVYGAIASENLGSRLGALGMSAGSGATSWWLVRAADRELALRDAREGEAAG